GGWDFSIPDRSQRVLDQNRRQAVLSGDDAVTVGPRRDAHEFAEAGAEGAQRGGADGAADHRDREIAAADERHGPCDTAGHEKGVRGLAERRLELATEVAGGHVLGRGESLDAQRSVEFTIDAVGGFRVLVQRWGWGQSTSASTMPASTSAGVAY